MKTSEQPIEWPTLLLLVATYLLWALGTTWLSTVSVTPIIAPRGSVVFNAKSLSSLPDPNTANIDPFMDDPDRFGISLDPKTALQELSVARGLGAPVYRVEGTGPDHARVFTAEVLLAGDVHATGEGTSKKTAEMAAALAAVSALHDAR